MYACELLFSADEGEKVRRELRRNLGGQCLCEMGRRCPLIPVDVGSLFAQQSPRSA